MTPSEAVALLPFWQCQLRIQDWDVRVEVVRHHAIDGNIGRCKAHEASREAILQLCDPEDLHPDTSDADRDLEVTLVHELLHVAFPSDRQGGRTSTAHERAIDSTARALVNLRRGTPR